jgi:hypothetical protein
MLWRLKKVFFSLITATHEHKKEKEKENSSSSLKVLTFAARSSTQIREHYHTVSRTTLTIYSSYSFTHN